MSTYYRPSKPIPLNDIKNNEVLREIGFEITNLKDKKYFCHEGNYIHFELNDKDEVIDLFRYGGNDADKILIPLEQMFKIEFISEYDLGYDDLAHADTSVRRFTIKDGQIHFQE